MSYCSNCGKEIQDGMQFCPNCGVPVYNDAEETMTNSTASVEEKAPKKRRKGIVAVIILLVVFAGALFLYSGASKINTYNQFVDLYNTMIEGTWKAESANILICKVWKNSIFKTADEETDKYTKADGGNGKFYDDFNDALETLYSDQNFIDELAEISSLQTEAETLIKGLAKHPKAFDEEYSDFKEFYNLFMKFTNMPLTVNGSLYSFTDDHNELDEKIADKIKELDIYFK